MPTVRFRNARSKIVRSQFTENYLSQGGANMKFTWHLFRWLLRECDTMLLYNFLTKVLPLTKLLWKFMRILANRLQK